MQDIKVTLVQSFLFWEDLEKNLAQFDDLLERVEASDLIILPEMFTTGFAVEDRKNAENFKGKAFRWLTKTAAKKQAVITGSFFAIENGAFYNRLLWMYPDGNYAIYDKRHLFRLAGEDKIFTKGEKRNIVNCGNWKFLPLICYDLRFPVWSKNTYDPHNGHAYDCLIYIANWPARRIYAWDQLLIARAIENQAYVIGVNRTGDDGNGIPHNGHSTIIDPKGKVIFKDTSAKTLVHNEILSGDLLKQFREKFQVGRDWDFFEIIN